MKRKNAAILKKQNETDARIFDFVVSLVPADFRDWNPNYSYRELLERLPDEQTAFDVEWIGELRDRIGEIIRERIGLPDSAIERFEECFYPLTESEKEVLER